MNKEKDEMKENKGNGVKRKEGRNGGAEARRKIRTELRKSGGKKS